MNKLALEYENDFAAWLECHIQLLQQKRFTDLDLEHLIAELTDMGRNNKIELENRFALLIAHLLKWQFQFNTLTERWSEWDGKSWRNTIIEQRFQINRNLRKNPSLKAYLSTALQEAYPDAVYLAAKETELPKDMFPEQCPYTCEQLLDDEFYPTGKSA